MKRSALRAAAAILWAACLAAQAEAADLHVARSGSDLADGLTWATALATVTAALEAAELTPEPDVIRVAEGTYAELVVVPPDVSLLGGFPEGGGTQDPALHVTILDGEFRGTVMEFGPGTDACLVEGFTIRNGRSRHIDKAGGVSIVEGSPTFRRCVIERNHGIQGGGVRSWGGAPLFEDCVVRENRASRLGLHDIGYWFQGTGAAVLAAGPNGDPRAIRFVRTRFEDNAGMPHAHIYSGGAFTFTTAFDGPTARLADTHPLLDDCLVRRNVSIRTVAPGRLERPEGAMLHLVDSSRASRIRSTLFRGNSLFVASSTHSFDDSTDVFENCEFSGTERAVLAAICPSGYILENCTIADNPGLMNPEPHWAGNRPRLVLRRSIVADPLATLPSGCNSELAIDLHDTLTVEGWARGSNIVVGMPDFVATPAGPYGLAQVASGQPSDSLGVDAGPETAVEVGLDAMSTRSDTAPDDGLVDWGVHYRTVWPELPGQVPDRAIEIVRGEHPLQLDRVAVTPALPFNDAPGRLSEPGVWFYVARWVYPPLRIVKDPSNDTITLLH